MRPAAAVVGYGKGIAKTGCGRMLPSGLVLKGRKAQSVSRATR